MDWTAIPTDDVIQRTADALSANGFGVFVARNGEEAKKKALELLPAGAQVMTMTSVTNETIGLYKEINGSDRYDPVRAKFKTMDASRVREKKMLGAAPEWVIGSVHAVTEDGHLLVASQTGSQIPAYVYGADRVIWIVGCQKIVKNTQDGISRIYEHCLPLEAERAKRAYGATGSAVNVLTVINAQTPHPGRCVVILVREKLGF